MTKVLAGRLAGMFRGRRASNLTTITAGLIALSTATLGFAVALALLPVLVLRLTSIDGILTPWAIDTTDLALVASRSALASMALSGVAFLAWLRRTVADDPGGSARRGPDAGPCGRLVVRPGRQPREALLDRPGSPRRSGRAG